MKAAMTIVIVAALAAMYGCHGQSSNLQGTRSLETTCQVELVGPPGPDGDTGAKGPTLTLVGPVSRSSPSDEQGTDAQGSTTARLADATGDAGATGSQGPAGPTGPQGPDGVIDRWISYRDFWFDTDKAVIHGADLDKVREIAAYMKNNPSLQLGIDGSTNPRATEWRDQDLGDRRVKAVRNALITAGVSANRISDGMFGDVQLRRDGRVEVLIKTDQLSQAQFGPAGPAGVVDRWTSYRDFWFDPDKAVIHGADSTKVGEIAAYMKNNPSLQLGIDGSANPRAAEWRDQDLEDRRVKAVRDALITAGVPANRISDGAFGDAQLRRDGRVEVLIKTETRLSQSP
jgi:outer membrane protein OmpA-like peptidoglycan-associated protein